MNTLKAPIILITLIVSLSLVEKITCQKSEIYKHSKQILSSADKLLTEKPVTITAFFAERSAGGKHDYYSEGPYWWPDPQNPRGPYIRKDGDRNPGCFLSHKNALLDFCESITTLTAAFIIKNDSQYLSKIEGHLKAWFIDTATIMNPSLSYAQAINGINTGRGIGLIDVIRLIDVANCCRYLEKEGLLDTITLEASKKWFTEFSVWMTSHPYGIDERDNNNNHSTWWGAQVAAYSLFCKRADLFVISQEQFKKQLEIQMAENGSFPDELSRTKPFMYSEYNLDAWTTFAIFISKNGQRNEELASKILETKLAVDFILLYKIKKLEWPYKTNLEPEIHQNQRDYLLFASYLFKDESYKKIWKSLKPIKNDTMASLIIWDKLFGLWH